MPDSDLQITFGADASGVDQGVGQVKSALDGIGPSLDGFGKAFNDTAEKIKGGFEGVHTALDGLKASGQAGAEGLTGLAEAGGGATAVVAAVASVALGAASAIAAWAERTKDSSAATAEARQNASALDAAMTQAGKAFGQVGDTLAGAFAPTLTTITTGLTGMATAFETSYGSGGLAKTGVDLLVTSVNLLVAGLTGLVNWWRTEIQVVQDAGQTWSSAFQLASTATHDLQGALSNQLAPVFRTVQTSAASAWVDIQSGFGGLIKGVQAGYDLWKSFNRPLVAAIASIGGAFTTLEAPVTHAIQTMIDWVGKLAASVLSFLNSLPGVGVAIDRLKTNFASLVADTAQGLDVMVKPLTAQGFAPPASEPPPTAQGAQQSGAGSDPTSETQSQVDKTAAANAGLAQRDAINTQSNAAISDGDQQETNKYNAGQQQQVNVAQTSSQAKVQASHVATNSIIADNDRALKKFKSSMDALVSTFSRGLAQMVMGTKTFSQVMRSMGQLILEDLFKIVDGMVDKWAWGVTEKVLTTTQGQAVLNALGLKDLAQQLAMDVKRTASAVTNATTQKTTLTAAQTAGLAQDTAFSTAQKAINAQTAFSGAIAAISPIPFIGPFIAPEIAADMAALASAAGGFDIPPGVNPVTQLHAQEMVLPARLANPMRSMMDDYAASKGGPWNAPAQSGGGDTHVHNYHVSAMDAGSFKSFLRGNKDPLSTVLQEMGRAGMKTA
jgi:hypothetical protein